MTDINSTNNDITFSKYLSGTAYVDITEQSKTLLSDNKLDEQEILGMTLMYEGAETTVGNLLSEKKAEGQEVSLNFLFGGEVDSTKVSISDMSTYGASKSNGKMSCTLTQEDIYNQLIDDMIWDQLKDSLKEVASQGLGTFSYDKDN